MEIWKATENYLKRALLGMRMELIANLKPPADAQGGHPIFFEILDRRANDKKVRDNSTSKKLDGPGAGFPHEKLAARNFIHIHYCQWLGFELRPPDRREQTSAKWVAFRKAVNEKVVVYRKKHGLR